MRLIDAYKIEYATDNESDCEMKLVTKEMIDSMPTIEAEPVIRCMDCAYGTKCKSTQHRLCERSGDLLLCTDYCSRAERRTE